MGYTRCPAYLLNTSNSFCSTSRLRFSRSFGGRMGVRFLMVIVRSPIHRIFIGTSFTYRNSISSRSSVLSLSNSAFNAIESKGAFVRSGDLRLLPDGGGAGFSQGRHRRGTGPQQRGICRPHDGKPRKLLLRRFMEQALPPGDRRAAPPEDGPGYQLV